jgi:hypothetical protein
MLIFGPVAMGSFGESFKDQEIEVQKQGFAEITTAKFL